MIDTITATDRLVQDLTANHTIAIPYDTGTPVVVFVAFALHQILELVRDQIFLFICGGSGNRMKC